MPVFDDFRHWGMWIGVSLLEKRGVVGYYAVHVRGKQTK
jgi:hypothetical protein